MYDTELATAILEALDAAFPSRLSFSELKSELPTLADIPVTEWVRTIYALHQRNKVVANLAWSDHQYDPVDVIDVAINASEHDARRTKDRKSEEPVRVDPLLQIHDRGQFDTDLAKLMRTAGVNNPLTLLMIDLDHFKRVNDRCGHLVGDQVLKRTAILIKSGCTGKGSCYRYGGEELVVLLPNHGVEEATPIAERIRRSIHEENFVSCPERITVSIGLATFPETTQDCGRLSKDADFALYEAKDAGRNRVSTAKGYVAKQVPIGDSTRRIDSVRLRVELQQGVPQNYILVIRNESTEELSVVEIYFDEGGLRLAASRPKPEEKWKVLPGGGQICFSPQPDPAIALLTLHNYPNGRFNTTIEVVLACELLGTTKEFRQKILVEVEPLNRLLRQLLG